MTLRGEHLERALDELLQLAVGGGAAAEVDPALRSFGASSDPRTPAEAHAAGRAREHFVLERHSPALQGVPVELALHGLLGEPEHLPDREPLEALVASFCSVFEVTEVRAGEGLWVRDLLAFGEHPLAEPDASQALARGDVLVGRLYPIGDGLHRLSTAAGVFRKAQLVEALSADLERAREGRRGVLRLSQLELESMFWARVEETERTRILSRAREILAGAGVGAAEVELIFARLASTPIEPERVAHGVNDALAEILAGLAFETEVDLDAARRALLDAWPLLVEPEHPHATRPGSIDPDSTDRAAAPSVREAMQAFDLGRGQGRDLEELFCQLERDLELEPEQELQADDGPAPDFPGVVGAMIEEFLWDTERERGAQRARAFGSLRKLSSFAASIGVLEELGARQLLSFAAVWLPEWGQLTGAEDARAVLHALRAFCAWAQERQELPLLELYERELASLEETLPRIAEANLARVPVDDAAAGEVLLVLAGAPDLRLQDGAGAELAPELPAQLAANLQPGDHLRVSRAADGGLCVHCCYPPECAGLKQPAE